MELSVSYNGDLELIEKLSEYKSVAHIFGATTQNLTGGGRNSEGLSQISRAEIKQAIELAHENGIEFNYLMNSSCMGNMEYTQSGYENIKRELDWICSIGADWVTIANPYIVELCRKMNPKIKISLSSFSMVESVQRAVFYDGLGVEEISVRENINRDFSLLKQMQENTKCRIQVIANQTCLYQCPFQFYHDNVMSHSSQLNKVDMRTPIDYCILNCVYNKFAYPEEIIKSRWIRPDDIGEYEKIGITKFKITDRTKSTKWLIRTVKAYDERRYDGNLADILNLVQVQNKRATGKIVQKENINLESGKQVRRLMKDYLMLDVNIDNRKLDNFLEHYKKSDCNSISCEKCGYCKRMADKAISFPRKEEIKNILKDMEILKKESFLEE